MTGSCVTGIESSPVIAEQKTERQRDRPNVFVALLQIYRLLGSEYIRLRNTRLSLKSLKSTNCVMTNSMDRFSINYDVKAD